MTNERLLGVSSPRRSVPSVRRTLFVRALLALVAISLLIVATASCSVSRRATKGATEPLVEAQDTLNFSPNTLIISYDPAVGSEPLLQDARRYGATVIYQYQNFNMVALRLPKGTSLAAGIAHFQKVRGVLQVSRDRIYHLTDPVRPRPEVM